MIGRLLAYYKARTGFMGEKKMSRKEVDQALVDKFIAGDNSSFEELLNNYASKIYAMALRLTKNPEDAEEVLQDVFVAVYRKIEGFQGKSSFSSWLYRVTVNASFMKLRKNRQDKSVKFDDLGVKGQEALMPRTTSSQDVDSLTYRHEMRDRLEEAVNTLPDEYRPVFTLRDVDGLTTQEVANVLQLTVPAVKSRLHRSRLLLRRRLKDYYKEYSDGSFAGHERIASNS